MGTQIKDIISVNITKENARLTRAGFGTILVLGEHSVSDSRSLTFNDPSEMVTAGFSTTDPLYKAAVSLTSQELSPPNFKIGRKLANVNEKQSITFSSVPDAGNWTIDLGGQTTASLSSTETNSTIKTALELLSNITEVTVTGDFTNGFIIEFTGADANTSFAQFTIPSNTLTTTGNAVTVTVKTLQNGSAAETWTAALNAVIAADIDWYGLVATTRVKSEILELDAIISTQQKIYGVSTDDSDVKTNTAGNIALTLQALSRGRTFHIWSGDQAKFPEAAGMGGIFPFNPGKSTWKFKTLEGITPDVLTSTEIANLKANGSNYFEAVAGRNLITSEGTMADGEFIDVTRGTDWIQARLSEDLLALLISNSKVPFTSQGLTAVEGIIMSRLDLASSSDFPILVKSSITVNVPKITAVLTADKVARLLQSVTFGGTLQGAIHKIILSGKIGV